MFGFSISYLFYRYGIRKENAEDDSSKRIFLENKIVREMKTDPLLEFLISIPYFILLFFFSSQIFVIQNCLNLKIEEFSPALFFEKKFCSFYIFGPKQSLQPHQSFSGSATWIIFLHVIKSMAPLTKRETKSFATTSRHADFSLFMFSLLYCPVALLPSELSSPYLSSIASALPLLVDVWSHFLKTLAHFNIYPGSCAKFCY